MPVNDIALIQLSHPLQFTKKIRPVKLPSGLKSNTSLSLSFVGRGIDEVCEILFEMTEVRQCNIN